MGSTRHQLKIVVGEMRAREAVHHAITDGLGGLQTIKTIWQGVKLSEKEVTLKTRQAQEEPLTRDICY